MRLKLLSSLLLMYSMNLGILIFIIPLYSKDLGADKMTVGFITSAYAIAYTVSSPLWGKASDILGRKLALSLGMLGYSVAVLLLAFVSDPGQIIIVRLLGVLLTPLFGPFRQLSSQICIHHKSEGRFSVQLEPFS
jgi:MFS family permease